MGGREGGSRKFLLRVETHELEEKRRGGKKERLNTLGRQATVTTLSLELHLRLSTSLLNKFILQMQQVILQ